MAFSATPPRCRLLIKVIDKVFIFVYRHLNIVEGNVTLADWMTNVSNKFDYQTTNGQLFPIITIEAGQKKRFRLNRLDRINSLPKTILF